MKTSQHSAGALLRGKSGCRCANPVAAPARARRIVVATPRGSVRQNRAERPVSGGGLGVARMNHALKVLVYGVVAAMQLVTALYLLGRYLPAAGHAGAAPPASHEAQPPG